MGNSPDTTSKLETIGSSSGHFRRRVEAIKDVVMISELDEVRQKDGWHVTKHRLATDWALDCPT